MIPPHLHVRRLTPPPLETLPYPSVPSAGRLSLTYMRRPSPPSHPVFPPGVLLFAPEFASDTTADDGAYFASLPRALNSLLVLLTTANFPDVMLAIYAKRRASCLFFVAFVLLGLFLLMNLILAAVFRNYKAQAADVTDVTDATDVTDVTDVTVLLMNLILAAAVARRP